MFAKKSAATGCENFSFCSSSSVNRKRDVYVFVDVFDCRIGLEKTTHQDKEKSTVKLL